MVFSADDRECETAESRAAGGRERDHVRGVAVVRGDDLAGTHHLEFDVIVCSGHEGTAAVYDAGGDEGEVRAVREDDGHVGRQFYLCGRAGGPDRIRCPGFAVPVRDDAQFAGFITDAIPAKAVFELAFSLSAEGSTVEEQFRFVAGGVDMHRGDLAFAAGPGPVRQDMRQRA